MRKFAALLFLLAVSCLSAAAVLAQDCPAIPDDCTPSIHDTDLGISADTMGIGAVVNITFEMDCLGGGPISPPCVVCVTYTWFYQDPNGNGDWLPLNGIDCQDNLEGAFTANCGTTNTSFLSTELRAGLPASRVNAYKCTVKIYPVPCDQMETYTGGSIWSGSVSGSITLGGGPGMP